MNLEIPFQQLLTAVKTLTPDEKARLKQELTEEETAEEDKSAFIEMLLKGPVFTDEQIHTIEENRKSISQWRTKS
jgi:hypothetical protein